MANSWYEHFYTAHFGFCRNDYSDKVIVDIGCGPRGSLEWADMAARRIGIDPLAGKYLKLGANQHQMEYICAPSENIPLADAECDAVFSFNSLDHVENVEQTVAEIARITRPGGYFLLLVEVNHPPTDCEPHELSPEKLIKLLTPTFDYDRLEVYRSVGGGMYNSIRFGDTCVDPESTRETGYLSAKFIRRKAT